MLEDRNLRGKVTNVTVAEESHLVMPCDHFKSLPTATVLWYFSNDSLGRKKLPVKRVVSSQRISVDSTGNYESILRPFRTRYHSLSIYFQTSKVSSR